MNKLCNKRSFLNGWCQLRAVDQPKVKKDILSALGITSGWYDRLNGKRKRLDIEEMEHIEAVFAKYGVVENIWGDDMMEE